MGGTTTGRVGGSSAVGIHPDGSGDGSLGGWVLAVGLFESISWGIRL